MLRENGCRTVLQLLEDGTRTHQGVTELARRVLDIMLAHGFLGEEEASIFKRVAATSS